MLLLQRKHPRTKAEGTRGGAGVCGRCYRPGTRGDIWMPPELKHLLAKSDEVKSCVFIRVCPVGRHKMGMTHSLPRGKTINNGSQCNMCEMSLALPDEARPLHLGSDFASLAAWRDGCEREGLRDRIFFHEITAAAFRPLVLAAFQRPTSWKNK